MDTIKCMQLISVNIQNYKSIENATINFNEINGGHTYTLIGENESGKSSILKAISLKDNLFKVQYSSDFKNDSEPIIIKFNYKFNPNCLDDFNKELKAKKIPDQLIASIDISDVILKIEFEPVQPTTAKRSIELKLSNSTNSHFTLEGAVVAIKDPAKTQEDFNSKKYLEDNFIEFFFSLSHKVIFWKSDSKYLITDPIILDTFSNTPLETSIPLKNCFELAGIKTTQIKKKILSLKGNHSERTNLIDQLQDKVTAHVRKIWPEHKIKIRFSIDETYISLLVEDEGVPYKTKTTNQRSDGFQQFVSFLLTISAQKNTDQLSNSLLLLDEPEVHLHPKGQENLRDELINISQSSHNNIVIFATHSNYMIDKNHLDRCYRILKEENATTKIESIQKSISSYAEVNYIVFNVPTSDYHNELYGNLKDNQNIANEEKFEEFLEKNKIPKEKAYKRSSGGKVVKEYQVTLPTYVRNLIHHPENTFNDPFTQEELIKSIKLLKGVNS